MPFATSHNVPRCPTNGDPFPAPASTTGHTRERRNPKGPHAAPPLSRSWTDRGRQTEFATMIRFLPTCHWYENRPYTPISSFPRTRESIPGRCLTIIDDGGTGAHFHSSVRRASTCMGDSSENNPRPTRRRGGFQTRPVVVERNSSPLLLTVISMISVHSVPQQLTDSEKASGRTPVYLRLRMSRVGVSALTPERLRAV